MDQKASGARLRILIVEDSEDDAKLVLRQLRSEGFDPHFERVVSGAAMRAALADRPWDIILSDYVIPGFGGPEALKIARHSGLELPFIVVSGKIGEEIAVEAMRAGASDYVMKEHLSRLGPAIRRELVEAETRRALKRSRVEWRAAFDSVQDAIFFHDAQFRVVRANLAYAAQARMPIAEIIGKPYWEVFPRTGGPLSACQSVAERSGCVAEEEVRLPGGETYWSRSFPIADASGKQLYSLHVLHDITERNRVRDALERSERHYRKLIEGGADVFFVLDRTGAIRYRSDSGSRVTGWETREVLGKSIFTFVDASSLEKARSVLAEVLRRPGVEISTELGARHKNGSPVELEMVGKNLLEDPDIEGIIVTARDITARKQGERALARVNRALRTLSACNEALVRARNESELLDSICRLIVETGGYLMTWVGYAEHDAAMTVRPVGRYEGEAAQYLASAQFSWADTELGRGPTGTAIRTGTVQINQNFLTNPNLLPWREAALERGYQSSIALPLRNASGTFGVLTIYAREPDAFGADEVKLLQELAEDLAFGIETLRMRADRDRIAYEHLHHEEILRQSLEGSIKAIAATVELRDAYTAGHQRRVGTLAAAIARELGLPDETIHGVELAASIHDLGKINVPAEILAKPGRLTNIEMMLVRTHAEAGYNIVKGIKFPWPIATMVWQHHERLDGSGYPQGLKDGEILLESRIMAVADVVEAMASHRPYRAAQGIDAALLEIARGKGTTLDAGAVEACLALFRGGRFGFQA